MVRAPTILILASVLLNAACGSSRKLGAVEEAGRSLPALPASRISIPVKIYMRPLLSVMDSLTTKTFTSAGWPNYYQSSCDFRYKYQFIRSPFSFSCYNNQVNITFDGQYQIAGSRCICAFNKQVSPWVSGSCGFGGEPLRRVQLGIHSSLQLLPGHQIRTLTHLEELHPIDRCNVTILQNDLTAEVMDSIRASVETYCSSFDSFVQSLNNSPDLQSWRAGGNRVMTLSQYGFLNLNASQLFVGPFYGDSDTLRFSLGLEASPLFSSDSMSLVTGQPLPPISGNSGPPGLETYLDASYQYSFLNQLLNDSLYNRPFEVEGRTFVIKSVNLSGNSQGRIALDVAFTGNRTGVLHISGTPLLDTANQVLTMPDIHFALDTRDMLMNIAKGLFHKKIMRELRGRSVFDLAALIQRNLPAINARLTQPLTPWMNTEGSIDEIRLLGLLPQKDRVRIQLLIKGELDITGTPPSSLINGF